jgi:hypothetical protein
MAGSDRLSGIELEKLTHEHSDPSSWRSFLLTFLAFVAVQSVFCWADFASPPSPYSAVEHYPLFQDYSNRTSRVSVAVAHLTPAHGFVIISAALTRYLTAPHLSSPIAISANITLLRKGRVVRAAGRQIGSVNVTFPPGVNLSNLFHLLSIDVTDFDSINVSAVFETDFHYCKGFLFQYQSENPNAKPVPGCARLSLSACALYGLVGYLWCITRGLSSTQRLESWALAVTACFAANPIGVLYESLDFLSPLTAVVFLSCHRLAVLSVLGDNQRLNRKIVASADALFVAVYAIVEWHARKWPEKFEQVLGACHAAYALVVIGLAAYAARQSGSTRYFTVMAHVAFVLVTVGLTLFSELYLSQSGSGNHSLLLYLSSHVLTSVIFLFLQSSLPSGYETLPAEGSISLDLTLDEEDGELAPTPD